MHHLLTHRLDLEVGEQQQVLQPTLLEGAFFQQT